ncbi:hypothetical protein QFZ84_001600 [Pseudomonas fluorescens]
MCQRPSDYKYFSFLQFLYISDTNHQTLEFIDLKQLFNNQTVTESG